MGVTHTPTGEGVPFQLGRLEKKPSNLSSLRPEPNIIMEDRKLQNLQSDQSSEKVLKNIESTQVQEIW